MTHAPLCHLYRRQPGLLPLCPTEGRLVKLLTFLGITNLTRVTYTWEGREYETELCSEAIAEWLRPDEVVVLLTAEADGHANWRNLQARLVGKVPVRPVHVPAGRDEGELW